MSKETRNWILIGFCLPVLTEFAGSFLLVMTNSGASAEGFAYILVLVMLIVAVPVTLIGNIFLVPRMVTGTAVYFARGLIIPGCYFMVVLIYWTGLWDNAIEPLLPSQEVKISTASSGPVAENSYESFYVVNSYGGTDEEQAEIEIYAREQFVRQTREDSTYLTANEMFYFVPRELYDPIYDAPNRESAIAVFRHRGSEGGTVLERVER